MAKSLQQQVQELYVGYLGRAAELNGLNFWVEGIEAGTYTLEDVAQEFTLSPEYTSQYDGLTVTQFVAKVYENVLGRTADGEGLTFWVNALNSGVTTDAGLVAMMLDNLGSLDQLNFDNRTSAAQAYTDAAGDNYDLDEGIAVVGGSNSGDTFTLTAGPDTFVGSARNDTFNALTVTANGDADTTLGAFDSLDGGAGHDTLNIYSNGVENVAGDLTSTTVIKNIETINIHNSGAGFGIVDAAKFAGATEINQIGAAGALINLAEGTTAGFKDLGGNLQVQVANDAASAAVVLKNVSDDSFVDVRADATAANSALSSVTLTGNVVDADEDGIDPIVLNVLAGKNVETVTVNTNLDVFLAVDNVGGKDVSTVDASASTGDINFYGADTVANVKTGTGDDLVSLNFAGTATANSASVSTGAGDDVILVEVERAAGNTKTVTATVDAGEGDDAILVGINAGVAYDIQAGAGDDIVVIDGAVKSSDKIDGGEGSDTVSLVGKTTLVEDDYIVFNKVLTNFETLQLVDVAVSNLDASKLGANYTTIGLADGSIVTKVGTQALIAEGDLTATAAGTNVAGATKVYAGNLNITATDYGTITANAENVDLTVDASLWDVEVELEGYAKSANVTLVQELNEDEDGYEGEAGFVLDTADVQTELTSLTLSGNGYANVFNADGSKLVTVDASELDSVTFDGEVAFGLGYSSDNTLAETIKLGAGQDFIMLAASSYDAVDTIEGLNLVALASDATELDDSVSDQIIVGTIDAADEFVQLTGFAKFTTDHTDLDLALLDAAKLGENNLVFQLGGDTYIYGDLGGDNLVTADDVLVKLTGNVDLDLLIDSLDVVI